jgi:hypothetical protein
VREVREALKRLSGKLPGERNACFLTTPEIVFRVRANGFDEANSLNLIDQFYPHEMI